ncbi:hypothetical protein [Methylobacterium sp. 174MFSha1.1]|uniref:hypothetical protein n=1 Tax=Methylobacterium sp. 174MFSha1.1 TaxID=1502749 RepID=UPI0011606432|nr:hypothetical protein [Methylobacterium sp. 174MFSha1.1]
MSALFPVTTPFSMEADEYVEDVTEFREWNNRLRSNLAPMQGHQSALDAVRLFEVLYFDEEEQLDLCVYVRARTTFEAKNVAINYYFPGDMLNDPTHAATAARMRGGTSITAIKIYDDPNITIEPIPWREVWSQMAKVL